MEPNPPKVRGELSDTARPQSHKHVRGRPRTVNAGHKHGDIAPVVGVVDDDKKPLGAW